jgi:C4-dicarboxylate-specific signal transduction histidine kinase
VVVIAAGLAPVSGADINLLHSSRLLALGEMAAGMAHELSQPLQVISAVVESAQLGLESGHPPDLEHQQRGNQEVLVQVERMRRLIEHLRTFSRDRSEAPREQVQLNSVVAAALQVTRAQLQNHGIELVLELTPGLAPVWGDPYRLEEVLLNLIHNARDALDEQGEGGAAGKRLVLRTWQRGGQVALEVEDTGKGLGEEERLRLFQPFFTTKPPGKGTGLGLSLAYAIVKDHQGELECHSQPGAGARFRVLLSAVAL